MGEKEQVIQALKATLLSVKGALTVRQCNRDYRELQGEPIPFRKLGYPTLEKLFLDVPGFKVYNANGEWFVDAIASKETQHIASMVAKQKSTKKSSKLNFSFQNRFPTRQDSWRKPAASNNNSYNNQYSNQYYRAKGNSYSNNNNAKFNSKYAKNNDAKQHYNAKPAALLPEPAKPIPQLHKTNLPSNSATTVESRAPVKNEPEKIKPSGKISASQRMSNLRDRLNTVPLQMPSSNNDVVVIQETSGPVSDVTPAHNLEPPPDSSSPVDRLEWTCRKLGLPQPVYKIHNLKNKKTSTYHCSVKVDSTYSATSYPAESPTESAARELAAARLLGALEGATGQLPSSAPPAAVAKLAQLVADHEAGLWATTVPHLYRERYQENLPNNWQDLVENCPLIIKDRVVNGLLVLLPNKEDASMTKTSEPSTTLPVYTDEFPDSDLPPLQFPTDNFWSVYVTVANSTIEIWVRIVGPEYSELFETLLEDMAEYYDIYGSTVDKSMLIKNSWYAVKLEDGGWQRAKILEIAEDSVTVFLGDHGDDELVTDFRCIKILEPQFRSLPAQAILCRLEGAEELAACAGSGEAVARRLQGEVLVAAPGPRHDPADPAVSVVLYDTSTARDLNLNKEIINDFCTAAVFNITQKPCEVEVGCVTEEGRVWVCRAGGARAVRAALALLTSGPYRRRLPASPAAPLPATAAAAPLYIVRTIDGDWVRCIIISGLDGEGTVRTQLVDSGLLLRAPLSSLVPLHAFSHALNSYPRQAKQVRLGEAERAAPSMTSRLRELLLNTQVLCRALAPAAAAASAAAAGPPHVELFVRTEPQNILASVNNAVLLEYECMQLQMTEKTKEEPNDSTDHVEALNRKKERIFRSVSSGGGGGGGAGNDEGRSLTAPGAPPPPALPHPGQCFDVFVAMAANPWNFIVQPNSTRHSLQAMMTSLQIECPKLSEKDAPINPVSGELCTVFYEKDNTWYRVTIAGTVSSEMVSVYFCDYGDLALFSSKALRPVPAAAPLARSLPPQAIRAKLYDVYPLHQDWTVEDCLRFQSLSVEQEFVGICKEVGRDPLNPNEPLLTLDLIDTSTEEDVYLNKQLVSEGRARHATTPTTDQ